MIGENITKHLSPRLQKSFLLMVGDEAALLIPPRRGGSGIEPIFAPHKDNKAIENIIQTLRLLHKTPILMIADNLGQEIRHETLPPLSYLDKRNLLKRRMGNAFPQNQSKPPLQDYLMLREDKALLLCLHREGGIAFWESKLKKEKSNFQGTLLLPLEGSDIITKLCPDTKKGWGLLLSFERTGGFRQIITKDGQPVLTRLTPALPLGASSAYIAGTLAVDIGATKDYLARFGLIDGAPFHLAALLPENLHRAFASIGSAVTQMTILTPHEAAQKLGLTYGPAAEDPASDLLFASWIQHKILAQKRLLRPQEKLSQQHQDIRQLGFLITSILWFILFLPVLSNFPSLAQKWHEAYRVQSSISLLQDQLMEEESHLAPLTEPLGRLRQAIAHERIFHKETATPFDDMTLLSQRLKEEDLQLESLTWHKKQTPQGISFETNFTLYQAEDQSPQTLAQKFTEKTPENIRVTPKETQSFLTQSLSFTWIRSVL